MPLGTEVGLGQASVLDGDQAPPLPQGGGAAPQFSVHICCGQMPLGRKVGLSPSDIVLDGDTAPLPPRERSTSIFGPCLLWQNGWMDQYGTWYRRSPWPSDIVLDGDPATSPKGARPPIFGPCLLRPNSWIDEDSTCK